MSAKICRKCKVSQPLENFYAYKNNSKIYSACKGCCYKQNMAWRTNNPEKYKAGYAGRTGWTNENRKKYASDAREKHDSYLWRTYGITLDQYEAMLKSQGGVCAICKQQCNRQNSKRYCVDHDHDTGAIRGLLCFQCNVGIGKFKESPDILQEAARYMQRHKPSCEAA